MAARATERLEVDLYAVVPPQIGVRGGPTCGEDPPDDIARVVLFYASDESDSITNQNIVADAGWV